MGATELRKSTANGAYRLATSASFVADGYQDLLNYWQATVIKGNPAEISALAGVNEVESRGVDSVGSGLADPARVVKELALRERCIIVMTGPDDWISDGDSVFKLSNGHPLLATITASGCIVGTAVAIFCGAINMIAREQGEVTTVDFGNGRLVQGDMLAAAVAGVLAITVAGEIAAERADVRGPGTFLPALLDELAIITPEVIVRRARVKQVF